MPLLPPRLKRKLRRLSLSLIRRGIKGEVFAPWWLILIIPLLLVLLFPLFHRPPSVPKFKTGLLSHFTAGNSIYSVNIGSRLSRQPTVNFSAAGNNLEFTLRTDQKITPTQKDNLVTFKNILPNIDLNYRPLLNGVKEEIVLQKPVKDNTFLFTVDPKGNRPIKIIDDVYSSVFRDKGGNYAFHFDQPFAVDAKGNRTDSVTFQLEVDPDNQKLFLGRLTVSPAWLNDQNRVYPITIDPTVVYDTTSEFANGYFDNSRDTGSGNFPLIESYYQQLFPDKTTVSLWHFDETVNDTCSGGQDACDISGFAHHGTATGTTINTTTPVLGPAARTFAGSISHIITVPDSTDFTFGTGDFSIELWVNPSVITGNYEGILGTYDGNGFMLTTSYITDGNIAWWNVTNGWIDTGVTLSLNTWQHLAVVRESGTIRIYLNGDLINTTASWTGNIDGTDLTIGGWNSGYAYLTGSLDEIRLTKGYARSVTEIKAAASKRPSAVYTSPVIQLTNVLDYTNFTWTELGARTADAEVATSSANLAAAYNFNATSGATANNDAEGTSCGGTPANCDGTLTSFANTTGQDVAVGSGWTTANKRWGAGSLMFDGVDDHVDLGADNSLNFTSSFTLEAWIKQNTTSGAVTRIIEKDYTVSYLFGLTTGNALSVYLMNAERALTNPGVIEVGKWYYVAAVYDDTANTIKIYINGKETPLVAGGTYSGAITGTTRTVKIGKAWSSTTQTFNGEIDAVRLYSRALPAHEILANSRFANLEFQTRSSYDNLTWEAWKSTASESALLSLDSDAASWSFDALATGAHQAKTSDTATKVEGTGSLKVEAGILQTSATMRGLWHLNETSGTIYNSSALAGLELTGTNTPTLAVGFSDKAYSFADSSNEYFSCTDANCGGTTKLDADSNTGWTFGAWVYPTAFSSSVANGIMSKTGSSSGFLLAANSSGQLRAEMGNSVCSDSSGFGYQSAATLTANQWNHVAVTVTAANPGVLKIYLNGILKYTSSTTAYYCNQTGSFYLGSINGSTNYGWNGRIDETFVSGSVYSDTDVIELYRAGYGRTLSRTISAADLSTAAHVPFYFASPNLGANVTLTAGESAFANYESDANTTAFWHLDEISGSGAYLRDATGTSLDITPTGTVANKGQIGNGRYFNGTSDYLTAANNAAWNFGSGDFSLDWWEFRTSATAGKPSFTRDGTASYQAFLAGYSDGTNLQFYSSSNGSSWDIASAKVMGPINLNQWNHFAIIRSSTNFYIYKNGRLIDTWTSSGTLLTNSNPLTLGRYNTSNYFSGLLDEFRVSKGYARTQAEIRAAYEAGLRTHTLTNDFKASLTTNLIADSADTSFTINATTYGLSQMGDGLSYDNKIIVQETVNGSTYRAQGTVSAITASSGAVNVSAWDSGSTFPAGGFTANAVVFKWQRVYADFNSALASQIDATTNLTLRLLNPNEPLTFWLDDLRKNTAYYSDPTSNTFATANDSTVYPYFQYRAILTNTNPLVSAQLSQTSLDYSQDVNPNAPTHVDYSFFQESIRTTDNTPTARFTSTDTESGDTIYQFEWYTDSDFSGATTKTSDVDSGFANVTTPADTSPFNSGDTISYTFSTLANNTYYYRVRGKNTHTAAQWSSWSTTRSFTVATANLKNDWYQTEADQFALNTITNNSPVGGFTFDSTNETVYLGSGDYTYSQAVTITNGGATLTNYDVLIELDTATLITAGKMQADCDDIRFYDSDQTTLLNFWLEQGCNTATTQFWVRVPSIQNPSRIIYLVYGSPSAVSASQSWSGNFILMSNATCPAGWTRVSALDGKFPRGNTTTGGTSSTSTHNHTESGSTGGPSATFGSGLSGDTAWGSASHTHTYSFTSSTVDHTPTYVDTVFCQKSVPLGLIATNFLIPHSTTLPAGWTRDTAYDTKFPRGASTYGGTGGTTTHANTVGSFTTGNNSANSDNVFVGGCCTDGALSPHTHGYSAAASLDAANNLPPYEDFIFATPNSVIKFAPSVISFFDVAPPYGWTRYSALDSAFPRSNSTAGGTGGSATHTHTYSVNTGSASSVAYINISGNRSMNRDHTHVASGTTDSGSSLPPYLDYLVYQRNSNSEISLAYGSESNVYSSSLLTSAITADYIYTSLYWGNLIFTDAEGAGDIKYQIYYDVAGTPTIVPDATLAGNSTGFDTFPVNLHALNTTTYPILYLKANFSTSSTSNFPTLSDWTVNLSNKPIGTIGGNLYVDRDYPFHDNYVTDSTPTMLVTARDLDGDYIRYKIKLCENSGMTLNCQTFDQTVSQTGWSGQDTQSSTAYQFNIGTGENTQGAYTIQTPLTDKQQYWWQAWAIDPADTNTWSDDPPDTFYFWFYAIPTAPSVCTMEQNPYNNTMRVSWIDTTPYEIRYNIERSVNEGAFSEIAVISADSTSYTNTGITPNSSYQYRIRARNGQLSPHDWEIFSGYCTTATTATGSGNLLLEGVQLEGLRLD